MESSLLEMLESGLMNANASRYLSAIGLVLLLWDHIITIGDEIQLIWPARSSFAKWAFLVNRYLVPCVLIDVAYFLNHFGGSPIPDSVSIVSLEAAQALIVMRLTTLWDHDKRIAKFHNWVLILSAICTFTLMGIALWQFDGDIQFNALLGTCITTHSTRILSAVWAIPMVFILLALISTCYVGFERPRASQTALSKVLVRDGIIVLLILTVLRLFNLVSAAVASASMATLGVFFVWAMTTLVLNRSLLDIQKTESQNHDLALSGRPPTPFGIEAGSLNTLEGLADKPPYLQWSRDSGDAYFSDVNSLRQASVIMTVDTAKFTV